MNAGRIRRTGPAVLATACLVVAAGSARGATTGPSWFDFVLVEANSGGSSGGHVALCLEERCYHFQQARGAELLLVRESRARFAHTYRALGNRGLEVHRIEVGEDGRQRLADALEDAARVQDRQLAVRQALVEDRELLEYVRQAHDSPAAGPAAAHALPGPRIPGVGYFFGDEQPALPTSAPASARADVLLDLRWQQEASSDAAASLEGAPGRVPADPDIPPSATISALARRIRSRHGPGVLEERTASLTGEIRSLSPTFPELVLPAGGVLPPRTTGLAERHRELLGELLAIDVLRRGTGLQPAALLSSDAPELALDDRERTVLRERASTLEDELVALFGSPRPDRGYPLLVGMARLAALETSIATGALRLLDTFPLDAPLLRPSAWAGQEDAMDQLVGERRSELAAARLAFFADAGRSEAGWSRLELAANRFTELDLARRARIPVRVHTETPVPGRSAWRADWPLPELDGDALERALALALSRERAYAEALAELYRYDLVRRNCATEIVRIVRAAADRPPSPPDGSAPLPIQGTGPPDGLLDFIPFLAARSVAADPRHVASWTEPSARRLALARELSSGNAAMVALMVALRESNVWTSRIGSRNEHDPLFTFFTDDVFLVRPLYGAVNLVTGLLGATAGLLLLPVDRGDLLRGGASGVVYSLPELAFVNIRKGSFAIAPEAWLRDDGGNVSSRHPS